MPIPPIYDPLPFDRTESLTKIKRITQMLKHLLSNESKNIKYLYFYALFSGLLSLVIPLGIQTIVGLIMAGRISTSWFFLVMVITASVFVVGVTRIAQLSILDNLQRKFFVLFAYKFKTAIAKLKLKADYQTESVVKTTGKFLDIVTFQKSLSKLLTDFTIQLLKALSGLVLLGLYHPLFIIFGGIVLLVIYFSFKFTWVKGFDTARMESDAKFQTAENLRKWAEINDFPEQELDQSIANYSTHRRSHYLILKRQAWLGIIIKTLLTAVMLIFGSYLLVNQKISLGQFVAAEILIITMLDAIEKLIITVEYIYDCGISIEKLNTINAYENS